jgi:hypothetical protein
MTARVDLAFVAMAALALMLSGVVAARAAVQNCSIYPERCQYGANGVYYFYPQGYRMPVPGAATPTNRAAWGCLATDGQARGRSWGYPNRLSASYSALSACAKSSTRCRIITCNPSVHSNYESYATFHNMHR